MRSRVASSGATRLAVALCLIAMMLITQAHEEDSGSGGHGEVLGDPLPLPENYQDACMQAAFHRFSVHNPSCTEVFYHGKNPGPECCEGLADFFGPESPRPSRNCWCVPEVWQWMQAASEKAYIEFKQFALVCSRQGYIVPFYTAEGEGEGYCNGIAPSDEDLAEAHVSGAHRTPEGYMTINAWLNSLQKDGLVLASLVTGIISAVGVSGMIWSGIADLVMAARASFAGRR